MAANRFRLQSSELNAPAAARTMLQLVAAADHAVEVDEWSVSFQGVDPSGTPVLVEVLRQTTAGTGGSTRNPVKDPDDWGETMQTTGLENIASSEPTAGDVLFAEHIHPHGGGYTWQAPWGKAIKVGGGDRLGMRITAAVAVDVVARFNGSE